MVKIGLSLFTIALLYSGCGSSACCQGDLPASDLKGNVAVEKLAPTAVITSERSECVEGSSIRFDGRSSVDSDGHIAAYEWLLDGQAAATNPVADFACEGPGTKRVCLKVTDDDNLSSEYVCQTFIVKAKEVAKIPPVALIDAPQFCTIGETIQVDGTGSSDQDGEVVAYDWQFGEAKSSFDKPELVCAKTGAQQLCLKVTDNDGLSDTNCTTIVGQQVPNKPPVAVLHSSAATCITGEHVTLDATGSSDSDGYVAHFNWSPAAEDIAKVPFDCETPGVYNVCVTVTDDKGLQSQQACQAISVQKPANKPPVAKIVALPESCTLGETLFADGTTSSDPDGNVTAYRWSLDANASYATDPKPLFACDREGTREICLVVEDNEGASSQKVCKSVEMVKPVIETIPPVAKMEIRMNDGDSVRSFTADCKGSYDPDSVDSDHNPQNDGKILSATFTVTKYFKDGTVQDPHSGSCPKWISIPDGLDYLVLTLKVTDDDGETTELTHTYRWDGEKLLLEE